MIFPTDAACDDSLKERLQNVPENRAGSSPLTYHPPLTPLCVPVGTRRFNYILRKETCMTRTAHGFRGMQVFSVLSRRTEKSSLNGRECLVLSNKLTSHSAPRRLELSAKKELQQTGFGDFCLRQPVIYSSNSLNSGSTVFFILA